MTHQMMYEILMALSTETYLCILAPMKNILLIFFIFFNDIYDMEIRRNREWEKIV